MKRVSLSLVFLAVASLALVAGCERDVEEAAAPAGQQQAQADAIPASLVLSAEPGGAKDVNVAKPGLKEGDEVVLRGVIGGRVDPIAANRAILTVIDPSIETCDRMEGDTCKTPWDACCVEKEQITASSATVQVVDADGRPLKAGLENVGGIGPLKTVVVVGTVRNVDEKNLVVDATGIYVKS